MDLLKKLTEISGIPSREKEICEFIEGELSPYVDETKIDKMGNLVGLKKGSGGPKIMLAAHMDQIGFIVSHVDDKGFLRVHPTGGFDPRTLMNQRVLVYGKKTLPGVIGSKPIHVLSAEEKKKSLKITDYFVDLGLPGDEVKENIEVGDMVTWGGEFSEIGNMYCSRAMDDRIGVYIMLEAMKRLKKHSATIYACATVQEEVGIRGATAAANEIQPDIGIALDVTIANDVPGSKPEEAVSIMGDGIAIKLMDNASISSYPLVKHFQKIGKDKDIKTQLEILPGGGTDAGAIWKVPGGAHVVTLSVPSRYVHSTVELVHKDDVQAGIDLLVAYLEIAGEVEYS